MEVTLENRFGVWVGLGIAFLVVLVIAGLFWGTYNLLATKSQAIDAPFDRGQM
jgi:hypothetical protein